MRIYNMLLHRSFPVFNCSDAVYVYGAVIVEEMLAKLHTSHKVSVAFAQRHYF